jgi:hypothetical protein
MEDILAIVFLFGGGTLAAVAFSPIGRALADRIRGRVAGPDATADVAELRDTMTAEMQDLRQEVSELAERLDFTERLLAKQREALPRAGGN